MIKRMDVYITHNDKMKGRISHLLYALQTKVDKTS